jgi:hypothetical protein
MAPRAKEFFFSHAEGYPACAVDQIKCLQAVIGKIKDGEDIKVVNCSWSPRKDDRPQFEVFI